jgi:SAM-dependent methyltransferase
MPRVNALSFQIFLLRFGFKDFFNGFYYFKWLEYPLAYNHLNFVEGGEYLDVGSGKSIFPLFVLLKTRSIVHIIDDQSIIKDSLNYYRGVATTAELNYLLDNRLFLHVISEGVTAFEFPNYFFDNISCISTLEHIRGNGDSMMMENIARILKKNGRAVVTFPFNNGDHIEEDNPAGVGYFQRIYNISSIKSRIIDPANLRVKEVIYFGERKISFGKAYSAGRCERIKWLLPSLSPLLWKIHHSYKGPFRDYHEKEIDKGAVGVVCIVFEKE